MVVGLVQLVVHVVVAIHRPGVFHREKLVRDGVDAALHFALDGRAESERVYHQRQVGHGRVNVVVLRAHLHVKVARHSVDCKRKVDDLDMLRSIYAE